MAGAHFGITRFEVNLLRQFRDDHLERPPGSEERLRARLERPVERPLIHAVDFGDPLVPDVVETIQAAVEDRPARTDVPHAPDRCPARPAAWSLVRDRHAQPRLCVLHRTRRHARQACSVGHEMVPSRAPLHVVSWAPGRVVVANSFDLSSRADGIRIGSRWRRRLATSRRARVPGRLPPGRDKNRWDAKT
jgi:hypothetical protein